MKASNASVGAIIVAAGKSRRMGGIEKMRALLHGRPVLARVVEVFQNCPRVDRIVVVVHQKDAEWGQKLVARWGWPKVGPICPGGPRRQDSVGNGLRQLGPCDLVIVHDGARPMVTEDLIHRGIEAAEETGAAVAAVPVKDTIKLAGDNNIVTETPPRELLWAVQTPQVFRRDIITEAYQKVTGDATDDASLVERLGYKVKLYMGSYDNIKVTTPDDLALATILLQKRGK